MFENIVNTRMVIIIIIFGYTFITLDICLKKIGFKWTMTEMNLRRNLLCDTETLITLKFQMQQ